MKDGSLGTILGSIGETYINRTADSFVDALVHAETEGIIGRIARTYAATPETRMRNQLQRALAASGTDIADKFAVAGNEFNNRLAVILGASTVPGTSPENLVPSKTIFPGPDPASFRELEQQRQAEIVKKLEAEKLRKQLGTQLTLLASSLGGAAAGGGGQFAQVGGQFGSTVGQLAGKAAGEAIGGTLGSIVPGFGTIAGGILGGMAGGLFDKDKNKKNQDRKNLAKIAANTRESADILEMQRQLMDVSRGAFNVPSDFTLPQYTPGALGGGGGVIIQQTNDIRPVIHINSNDPERVVDVLREQFAPMLQEELGKIGN